MEEADPEAPAARMEGDLAAPTTLVAVAGVEEAVTLAVAGDPPPEIRAGMAAEVLVDPTSSAGQARRARREVVEMPPAMAMLTMPEVPVLVGLGLMDQARQQQESLDD